MSFDVRLPIGLMLVGIGILVAGYGLVSDPSIYERSLGINVNLWWGGFLLVAGIVLLVLSRHSMKSQG